MAMVDLAIQSLLEMDGRKGEKRALNVGFG
jgi:hypothetical protein